MVRKLVSIPNKVCAMPAPSTYSRFRVLAARDRCALKEDGCVVIPDLASPETMDQIRAELEPDVVATTGGNTDFLGFHHPPYAAP